MTTQTEQHLIQRYNEKKIKDETNPINFSFIFEKFCDFLKYSFLDESFPYHKPVNIYKSFNFLTQFSVFICKNKVTYEETRLNLKIYCITPTFVYVFK